MSPNLITKIQRNLIYNNKPLQQNSRTLSNRPMIQSPQQLIDQLNRKISLLDQYASTLEKQNLAKNNETSTLYAQLQDIRNENDILRSHLSRINQENIERMRREQTLAQIQKINNSVNSSVELEHVQEEVENESSSTTSHICQTTIACQTQFSLPQTDPSILHQSCTQQINQLLQTTQQKESKILSLTKESQDMYNTIIQLQDENQQLRKQYIEVETKFKTQSKQVKSYELQVQELRMVLEEEREVIEQDRTQMLAQRHNSEMVEGEVERLVRENNRLIEKIRMLEKEKNSFYSELRGKNVSPLKGSQFSSRQNIQNNPVKPSFIGVPYTSSDQKPQPQRFSSQFGIGKQKEKLKADRWRKIQEKINKVKEENEQLRANLTIH